MEQNEYDAFWGDGGGDKNRLGQILSCRFGRNCDYNHDRRSSRRWRNLVDSFVEWLNSKFATLVRPLTPEDGQPEASTSVAESLLGLQLPIVIRQYYPLVGTFDRFN